MKVFKIAVVFFALCVVLSSCAGSGRMGSKGCGCAAKKGMVGY